MWGIDPRDEDSRKLRLKIGRIIAELYHGYHGSRMKGEGLEFLGVRPHEYGDSPRHIDWMASGRSEEDTDLVVRVFAPERRLSVIILADLAPAMHAPSAKARYAQGLVELFARSAFFVGGRVRIVGVAKDVLSSSSWISSPDELIAHLRMADVPRLARQLREPHRNLSSLFSEWQPKNTLIVFLSDLRTMDAVPMKFLSVLNLERDNIHVAYAVLDEWWGFTPSAHLVLLRHPETHQTVYMDMREGGEMHQEVIMNDKRILALRTDYRSSGLRVTTLPLAHKDPLREFARQWMKQEELFD